jgi:hypothetical protein
MLLAEHGEVEQAITLLRPHADAGDGAAAYRMVELLADDGRMAELRAEVDAGTAHAAEYFARTQNDVPMRQAPD